MGASKKKTKKKAQKSEEMQVEFKPRPKWTDRRDNTSQGKQVCFSPFFSPYFYEVVYLFLLHSPSRAPSFCLLLTRYLQDQRPPIGRWDGTGVNLVPPSSLSLSSLLSSLPLIFFLFLLLTSIVPTQSQFNKS